MSEQMKNSRNIALNIEQEKFKMQAEFKIEIEQLLNEQQIKYEAELREVS